MLLGVDETDNGAVNGFPVAYFAPTYGMMMDTWRLVCAMCIDFTRVKHSDEMYLELHGGGVIRFWSLDNPDRARGGKYKRVVIDEAAMVHDLDYAWNKVIRAMLADMIGDAWFFSTPKGRMNYFYELFQKSQKFDNWVSWQQPTASNPYINAGEIEEAQLSLDPITFAQEWLASFVTDGLDAFAYCYSLEKHVAGTVLNPRLPVYLSFDFNVNPISCCVFQHDEMRSWIRGIEAIKLKNSNIYEMCDYIAAKYGRYTFMVTGDSTGRGRSALVQDNINYYTVIKSKLGLSNGQMKLPNVNPPIKENRVLLNSVLYHLDVKLDPALCKGLIFDLENAKVTGDGGLQKTDRNDPTQQLDLLDCLRYYCNTFFRDILKG